MKYNKNCQTCQDLKFATKQRDDIYNALDKARTQEDFQHWNKCLKYWLDKIESLEAIDPEIQAEKKEQKEKHEKYANKLDELCKTFGLVNNHKYYYMHELGWGFDIQWKSNYAGHLRYQDIDFIEAYLDGKIGEEYDQETLGKMLAIVFEQQAFWQMGGNVAVHIPNNIFERRNQLIAEAKTA